MKKALIASVSAAALLVPVTAMAQDDTVKFGILLALEGAFAEGGADGVRNVELAIQQADGMAGGKKIETVVAPTDTTPDTTVRQARKRVTSYVYRARRPFIPEKILSVLNGELPGVIRAKGHFWIATRPDRVAEFSLAGALSSIKPLGTWWAAVPHERWPDHDSARDYMTNHWQEPWGDRRQEIAFIGAGIDWPTLKARLDAALLPEVVAGGPEALPDLPDPFPLWRRAEAAA